MFRFVNASNSLRPVLLLNLRNNTGIIVPASPLQHSRFGFSDVRYNSSTTSSNHKVNAFIQQSQQDPLLKEALDSGIGVKLNYFREQISLLNQYRLEGSNIESQRAFSTTFHNILDLFNDSELRASFGMGDLLKYSLALNTSIHYNRINRLSGSKNRDKDQYKNENFLDELTMKRALLSLTEIISNGEMNKILNVSSLRNFFSAMRQFEFYNESIDVWEQGVNDNELSGLFLDDRVLSIILPIAYEIERFSYDEVARIYELNTKDRSFIDKDLISAIGKIAISAGDFNRGLDCLEQLLKIFDTPNQKNQVVHALGDLHLSFIGHCKDITISRHFFDKVIHYDLPYPVKLRVSHVQSLLQNCFDSNESLQEILYFWKGAISHYSSDKKTIEMNARYAKLNNSFFQIFFKMYPELTDESFDELKQIIKTYNDTKSLDEPFMNTLITNYCWGDKNVFQQLVQNYDIYNIKRTQVSYRVALKSMGDINGFSNEEILEKWHDALTNLDKSKYTYIPNADWSSLRSATIQSQAQDDRRGLYFDIMGHYKDYFQDRKAAHNFIRLWLNNDSHILQDLNKVRNNEAFTSVVITTPQFHHLKPQVHFNSILDHLSV